MTTGPKPPVNALETDLQELEDVSEKMTLDNEVADDRSNGSRTKRDALEGVL